jgi:hypothetical protein
VIPGSNVGIGDDDEEEASVTEMDREIDVRGVLYLKSSR